LWIMPVIAPRLRDVAGNPCECANNQITAPVPIDEGVECGVGPDDTEASGGPLRRDEHSIDG